MGLMFVLLGLLDGAGTLAGFAYGPIREIERILPDGRFGRSRGARCAVYHVMRKPNVSEVRPVPRT